MEVLKNIWVYISNQILSITFFDILDIAIVSVIFYYVFRFVRVRRAGKLATGILVIIALLFLSEMLNMFALNYLLQNIVQVGIIGLVIVFQAELRTFLEKMGGTTFIGSLNKRGTSKSTIRCIENVVESCVSLSEEKTGAIIVFERSTKLGDVIKTGTIINADLTPILIKNIFFNKAPLHDGAVVIREDRVYSAGCFLPLSFDEAIVKELGTRHRAAIGMSENSDSVVVVVSEETGIISIAVDGVLTRGYNQATLKNTLVQLLIKEESKLSKRIKK